MKREKGNANLQKKSCLIQVDMDDLWVIRQMHKKDKIDYSEDEQYYQ